MSANPSGGFHPLDLPLALNCGASGTVCLRPNQFPRPIFSRGMTLEGIIPIVILYTLGDVLGLPDIKLAARILQYVDPEHEIGSPPWTLFATFSRCLLRKRKRSLSTWDI